MISLASREVGPRPERVGRLTAPALEASMETGAGLIADGKTRNRDSRFVV